MNVRDPLGFGLALQRRGSMVYFTDGFLGYWRCASCGERKATDEAASRHLCREVIEA
jgi:hypothetical protein